MFPVSVLATPFGNRTEEKEEIELTTITQNATGDKTPFLYIIRAFCLYLSCSSFRESWNLYQETLGTVQVALDMMSV